VSTDRLVYRFWIVYCYVLSGGMLGFFLGLGVFALVERNGVIALASVYFSLAAIQFFNRVVRRIIFRRIRRAVRMLEGGGRADRPLPPPNREAGAVGRFDCPRGNEHE